MRLITRRTRRGYLLLELCIAIFVVSISVVSCYTLVEMGRLLSAQSSLQVTAFQIARQKLQYLKGLRFANRNLTNGSVFPISPNQISQFPAASFTGTYSVTNYAPSGWLPMQQLSVRVSWTRPLNPSSAISSYVELNELVGQEPGR